jgi:glycosyltransferase involved in cell wall biosynthesis
MSLSVSVALATYNGAQFVEQQVRSILEQTHPPDELVVSDDGSSDATVELVESAIAATGLPGLRVVILRSGERLGVVGNFARAIEATSGDLVALSDHDDVWQPNRLSTVIPLFEREPRLLFSHADARLVGPDGASLGTTLLQSLGVRTKERDAIARGEAFEAYIRRNLATGATSMFRRSLLDAALPFPNEWVHDEWLAIIAAAIGEVRLVDEQLVDYRQHGSNEIGVEDPTVRYRVGRMLMRRGDRYEQLSVRSRLLADRLSQLNVAADVMALANDKARFEEARARYPASRLARIGPVLREFVAGSYRTLSSQGDLDVVRDLVQPK